MRQINYNKPLPTDPGPSTPYASFRGSLMSVDEFGARNRPTLRPRKSNDSFIPPNTVSKRTSFIDLGEGQAPPSGFLTSLKGRLSKKRSAPLLGNSLSAPPFYMSDYSTTPSGGSSLDNSPSSSVPRDSYFSLSTKPSKSFREDRKRTAIPEEIIEGIGRGVRFPPKCQNETADETTDVAEDVDISKGKYRAIPLRRRHGTLVHAYTAGEAPYAQSYDKVDLQSYVSHSFISLALRLTCLRSDFYFDTLLKRLKPKDMPTFHDYKNPPQEVLDLGCGEGIWVKDAAAAWADAGTKVVGFDLVDLVSKDTSGPSNASWSLGN